MHQSLQKLRKPITSEHFFHDIFVTEFNIYFGYPRIDTCSICDRLKLKIQEEVEESEKDKLQQELDAHQTLAKDGYDTFHYDQKLSKISWNVN